MFRKARRPRVPRAAVFAPAAAIALCVRGACRTADASARTREGDFPYLVPSPFAAMIADVVNRRPGWGVVRTVPFQYFGNDPRNRSARALGNPSDPAKTTL